MKVGFVGLGKMGLPMTKNLLKAGFEVWVVSRSRGPIEAAVAAGAREAENPADLARRVDVALTCVPLPETVEEVYLGESGLLSGARPGLILADHSTVGPELNRKIEAAAKEKGAAFLDAPVSGGPMGAEAGTLSIMVGGEREAFEKALPVFRAMGRHVVHFGPSGSGSVVKLINNMLVGIHELAISEALLLATRAGIDLDQLYEMLMNSTGGSAMLARSFPFIAARDFAARFSIDLLHKDLRLLLEMAEQLGIDVPGGRLAYAAVDEAKKAGYGELDIVSMLLPMEERHGVEVKKAAK